MKTEKYLEQLKKSYINNEPSGKFLSQGWESLEKNLGKQKDGWFNYFYKHGAVVAGIVLILILGSVFSLFQVAQGSLPGEPLYPVKKISEEVMSVAKPQVKVENRAREIVDMAKNRKDQKKLEKTIKEYEENVEKERRKASRSEKEKEKLIRKLKKQEEEFEKISEKSEFHEEIKKAINITRSGRSEVEIKIKIENGEVKGLKDEEKVDSEEKEDKDGEEGQED